MTPAQLKILWDKFQELPSSHVVLVLIVGNILFDKVGVTVQEFLDSVSAVPQVLVTVATAESNVLERISTCESNLLEAIKKENAQ